MQREGEELIDCVSQPFSSTTRTGRDLAVLLDFLLPKEMREAEVRVPVLMMQPLHHNAI